MCARTGNKQIDPLFSSFQVYVRMYVKKIPRSIFARVWTVVLFPRRKNWRKKKILYFFTAVYAKYLCSKDVRENKQNNAQEANGILESKKIFSFIGPRPPRLQLYAYHWNVKGKKQLETKFLC